MLRKGLYRAVEAPSTRPIVLSMINGSYCRRRRRLTIFEPDEMKFGVSLTLVCKLYYRRRLGERFFFTHILGTKYHQISKCFFETCGVYNPVSAVLN